MGDILKEIESMSDNLFGNLSTSYRFQIVTKDGKIVDAYDLSSTALNIDDPYFFNEPDSADWMRGRTEVIGVAEERIQGYIAKLKERYQKSPNEKLKKQLELLENAAAIIVKKTPYYPRKSGAHLDTLRGHRNMQARKLGIIIE